MLTLMTGTAVAQVIPLAISPILTRLYTPAEFGVLAIFMSIAAVLSSISSGRYELAIMISDSEEEAINLAAVGTVIALILSTIVFLVVLIFRGALATSLGVPAIAPWLFLMPAIVLFSGINNVLTYANNRQKNYRVMAETRVIKSIILASVQLTAGFMRAGSIGLISGYASSVILANMRLMKASVKGYDLRSIIDARIMKSLSIRYRAFPTYSMPAIFANTLSQNYLSIMIASIYGVQALGYYALVQRVLGAPSSLIGGSISQVFFQSAAEEKKRTGLAVTAFNKVLRTLTLFSIPIFLCVFFLSDKLFFYVFGASWKVSGELSAILAPLFAIQFIVAALTTINSVFEKQKISLAWQVFLLSTTVFSLHFSKTLGMNLSQFILMYSILISMCYIILLYALYLVSRGKL
ncbi:oligosaccharide flippase family protein [uncultured Sphingopyxis sp.]|uniref:oligosaccharide flippase family protein n=1 Tax=uncultured Sphingopyxis sp. TaxID=310581 RepID=UPI0025D16745|nr:oligosaccharide flippase family protein [uncultured Sphingopyxis sp.]